MSISASLRIFGICCPLDEYQCPLNSQTLSKLLNSISSTEALKVLKVVFRFVTTVLHLVLHWSTTPGGQESFWMITLLGMICSEVSCITKSYSL